MFRKQLEETHPLGVSLRTFTVKLIRGEQRLFQFRKERKEKKKKPTLKIVFG